MKILFSGDLHIGRHSSRIPQSLDGPKYSAARAWERIVDIATEDKYEIVLLSGDIADQDNDYYEAIGPLERGIQRLGEAGIRTVL